MPLIRLIYFSENQIDPGVGSAIRVLGDVLSKSHKNNRRDNITGALLFDKQWFIQALEGERALVWSAFERIREDERHSEVMVAEAVDIQQRIFANWWMGLATKNDANSTVFAPYLRKGQLDPRPMNAAEMLALMKAVSQLGLQRELAEAKMA